MLHENHKRAGSFGDDAASYDRSRPSYPDAMVDDLVRDFGHRVLDVGCGTGIAARQFRDRGCDVLGVEADERMAAVARHHGVDVDVARFEEWSPHHAPFDLVVAGQAWHWIDPSIGPSKAADVLRAGGALAAFWHSYHYEPSCHAALLAVYHDLAPELAEASLVLGTITEADIGEGRQGDLDALEGSGRYDSIVERTYASTRHYTASEWLEELVTHSSHRVADPAVVDMLVARLGQVLADRGGTVDVELLTSLLLATRG